jgi:hypothetical protein
VARPRIQQSVNPNSNFRATAPVLFDQFPLVSGSQLLNRGLHLARFRLVQAGELDKQWLGGLPRV